jgi:demethylmenaquinone methyltransferase/2-methoxy-6-polyprenyl-1,4-benzoquinol methylase
VLGLDFSAGMLRAARGRGVRSLVRGDALALPVADGAVDAVVSGFALRNFVDLAAAFAECARVLRPGGRLALLEVDRPASALLRLGHAVYFRHVVPALGALLVDRAAYAYLPASTAYLPDAAGLAVMLEEAGFDGVVKRPFLGGAAQLVTAARGAPAVRNGAARG